MPTPARLAKECTRSGPTAEVIHCALVTDGQSVRRNSRGEAWFNEDAVIRIDQSEFRRLHARLQPTTTSPLHDPFWQPPSPAAQPEGALLCWMAMMDGYTCLEMDPGYSTTVQGSFR